MPYLRIIKGSSIRKTPPISHNLASSAFYAPALGRALKSTMEEREGLAPITNAIVLTDDL